MGPLFLTLKWLHIVAIVSWMAGILYLYRLLIYVAENLDNDAVHKQLILMARKLYTIITVPAMIVSVVLGFGILGVVPQYARTGWFAWKFIGVLGLIAATMHAGKLIGRFAEKAPNLPSSKQLRILNELPTVLMIIIVGLVVFKPF
jgi:putative membrane protein